MTYIHSKQMEQCINAYIISLPSCRVQNNIFPELPLFILFFFLLLYVCVCG